MAAFGGYEEGNKMTVGPWGGQDGVRWDDGVYSTVRQIIICHGAAIASIQIEYDKNGNSDWSVRHGGAGALKTSKVVLNFPQEYLISMSGYYGAIENAYGGPEIVRSLTFESNRKKYGPFGIQRGTYFSLPMNGAKIVGFHGKSSWYLDSIGVHLKPLLHQNPLNNYETVTDKFKNQDGFEVDSMKKKKANDHFRGPEDYIFADGSHGSVERYKTPDGYDVQKVTKKKVLFTTQDRVGSGTISPMSPGAMNTTKQSTVSYGPWGGKGGMAFDDGINTSILEMHITSYDGCLISLQVRYDNNGHSFWAKKHGGNAGNRVDKIAFGSYENVTQITGCYGPIVLRGAPVVRSLTIHTNRRKYGPFGEEQGTPFSSNGSNIVGFHGREGSFIDSIGVHDAEATMPSIFSKPFASPLNHGFPRMKISDSDSDNDDYNNRDDQYIEPFNSNNFKIYDPVNSLPTYNPSTVKPRPIIVKDTYPTYLDTYPTQLENTKPKFGMPTTTLKDTHPSHLDAYPTHLENTNPKFGMPTTTLKDTHPTYLENTKPKFGMPITTLKDTHPTYSENIRPKFGMPTTTVEETHLIYLENSMPTVKDTHPIHLENSLPKFGMPATAIKDTHPMDFENTRPKFGMPATAIKDTHPMDFENTRPKFGMPTTTVKDTHPTYLEISMPIVKGTHPTHLENSRPKFGMPNTTMKDSHPMYLENPMPKFGMSNTAIKDTNGVKSDLGPWGGTGGKPFDDGIFNGVRTIFLAKGEAIYCMTIEYERNGDFIWSVRHGGSIEGNSHMIKFDYPNEFITCISGFHTSGDETKSLIKSLTFYTNKGKYGPYGEEIGTYFCSTKGEVKVVGFHGRSSYYLNSIGVHVQPLSHNNVHIQPYSHNPISGVKNYEGDHFKRLLNKFF